MKVGRAVAPDGIPIDIYKAFNEKLRSPLSEPFVLPRGAHQGVHIKGCPLSQLLFVLAIEPLAIAVRTHSQITGITIGGIENCLALYADDMFLFVRNLAMLLQAL